MTPAEWRRMAYAKVGGCGSDRQRELDRIRRAREARELEAWAADRRLSDAGHVICHDPGDEDRS